MILTLRLSVSYGSQCKQRRLTCTVLTEWFCTTDVESVYCTVCKESLYKPDTLHFYRVDQSEFVTVQHKASSALKWYHHATNPCVAGT